MNPEIISLIGMLLGLSFLIWFAFKGYAVAVLSPVAALIIMVFSRMPIIESLQKIYMGSFGTFATRNFIIIALGAIFGKLMADSGAAQSIAFKVIKIIKKFPKHEKFVAVFSLVAISTILVFGGISTFVIVFTLVAIAKKIFEELDIPWRFYTCGALGSGTYTMTMLPGSPMIQNLVPIPYLGTTAMAAPVLGSICAVVALGLGILWILYVVKKAEKTGEGFLPSGGEISKVNMDIGEDFNHPLWKCLLPSVALFITLNIFNQSPITALAIACILTYVIFFKQLSSKIKGSLMTGTNNGINAAVNVCLIVAFGSVVSAAPGYGLIISGLNNIPGPPLVQLVLAVNLIAGFTGSSTGGLGIAMENMSQRFLEQGINPEIIHRLSAMSSGGLDSLPHNSSVINTLTVTKLTHKQGYLNYFVMTVIIPLICCALGVVLASMGIC